MQKPPDLSGLLLNGKYELVKQLGFGGFGVVYLAKALHLENEPVVIKVLREKLAADATFAARFRREALAARLIKHQRIVTVYDYDYDPARPDAPAYIVMEFIAGESLCDYLERAGRLEVNHAAALFTHICATVGAMHKQSIWHRDLKPQNIMVLPPSDKPEQAVILDFGLAKIADGKVDDTKRRNCRVCSGPTWGWKFCATAHSCCAISS
jgi:serine/threonine-protein kinase